MDNHHLIFRSVKWKKYVKYNLILTFIFFRSFDSSVLMEFPAGQKHNDGWHKNEHAHNAYQSKRQVLPILSIILLHYRLILQTTASSLQVRVDSLFNPVPAVADADGAPILSSRQWPFRNLKLLEGFELREGSAYSVSVFCTRPDNDLIDRALFGTRAACFILRVPELMVFAVPGAGNTAKGEEESEETRSVEGSCGTLHSAVYTHVEDRLGLWLPLFQKWRVEIQLKK